MQDEHLRANILDCPRDDHPLEDRPWVQKALVRDVVLSGSVSLAEHCGAQ